MKSYLPVTREILWPEREGHMLVSLSSTHRGDPRSENHLWSYGIKVVFEIPPFGRTQIILEKNKWESLPKQIGSALKPMEVLYSLSQKEKEFSEVGLSTPREVGYFHQSTNLCCLVYLCDIWLLLSSKCSRNMAINLTRSIQKLGSLLDFSLWSHSTF